MSDFHLIVVGILQNQIERIMAAWIAESRRCGSITDVNDSCVDVALSDSEPLRAQDRSAAMGAQRHPRKAAASSSPAGTRTRSNLIAEVETTAEPPPGTTDATGIHAQHDGGRRRCG